MECKPEAWLTFVMFKHLQKLSNLNIINSGAATFPSRHKLTIANKCNLEDPVVGISMQVVFHELHVGHTIDIQAIVKIGDCQKNFL